ncbi:domain-containing [Fusarium albosuccineum]|uniref:Domain-containing n=1 Tax=Fusarium albosuccineum TaxID=1237068 RepID=A0A8H4LHH3_9HYPO|nr:domain-containing [Fusarium albosuccineum]
MTLLSRALLMSVAVGLGSPYKLWNSDIPDSFPESCREALSQDIDCPFVASKEHVMGYNVLKGPIGASYCPDPCRSSLNAFLANLIGSCGDDKYKFWKTLPKEQTAVEFARSIVWSRNILCLEDESGLCLEALYSQERGPCSECALKYQAMLFESDEAPPEEVREEYERTLVKCSIPKDSELYNYVSKSYSDLREGFEELQNKMATRLLSEMVSIEIQEEIVA